MTALRHLLIAGLLIGSGCASSRSYFQRGQYDKAVERAVSRLQRHPDDEEEIQVLQRAYKMGMDEHRQRVRELNMRKQPGDSVHLYQTYDQMETTQKRVRRLPAEVLHYLDLQFFPVTEKKIAAQKKAARHLYQRGANLLQQKSRLDAREAYEAFEMLTEILPGYKDTAQLMERAAELSKTHVVLTIENRSRTSLPDNFKEEFFSLFPAEFNSEWVRFDTQRPPDNIYDYHVQLSITAVDRSPEKVREKTHTETKTINAGWQYVVDENGNVKKDADGNDIKVRKTKEISCQVTEVTLKKAVTLSGRLDVSDAETRQILETDPLHAESQFEYEYVKANGNTNALSKEIRRKLDSDPRPFPRDATMLRNAVSKLKVAAKNALDQHRHLFEYP